MKARKREIWIFVIVLSICAVLIAGRGLKAGVTFDPNQYVIETRYSQRDADDIWLRQGGKQLVTLPRTFKWRSGGHAKELLSFLGSPQHTAEFMGDKLYIWKCSVRYDWDYSLEQPGNYLAIGFDYAGYIQSASSYVDLPYNAMSVTPEDLEQLTEYEKQDDDNW